MRPEFIEALDMVIRERGLNPNDFKFYDVYNLYLEGNTPINIVDKILGL